MRYTVEVNRMRLHARHGVMEQERTVGNEFEVSASLTLSDTGAADSDDIALTVSYADMAGIIRQTMAEPCRLLETVATRIAERLTVAFPQAGSGTVRVEKLTPPIPGTQMAGAAVSVSW